MNSIDRRFGIEIAIDFEFKCRYYHWFTGSFWGRNASTEGEELGGEVAEGLLIRKSCGTHGDREWGSFRALEKCREEKEGER